MTQKDLLLIITPSLVLLAKHIDPSLTDWFRVDWDGAISFHTKWNETIPGQCLICKKIINARTTKMWDEAEKHGLWHLKKSVLLRFL